MPKVPGPSRVSNCVSITTGDRAGVIARRNRLVEEYIDLVRPIAAALAQSLPPSFDLDDLVQAGSLGLMTAATRYRPKAHGGTPFSAYARPRIRGAILDSVKRGRYTANTMVSIDGSQETAAVLRAHQGVDQSIDQTRVRAKLERAAEHLPLRLQAILRAKYGRDLTLVQIAAILKIHPSWAKRLHGRALRELHAVLKRSPAA